MTVIVYSKGILAADSRATDDSGMILKTRKLSKLPNGTLLGSAGDADCRDVEAILGKSKQDKMPTRAVLSKTQTALQALWIWPDGKVYRVWIEEKESKWTAEILEILDGWAVVGSGSAYAAGAVLAGKSAIEAVRIACRLDQNCGLPVESLRLE